jgi:hypothetical protein
MNADFVYHFMFESARNYLEKAFDIKPERIFEKK